MLQHVFADQRHLLQQYVNQDVTKVPQVFIPYKEVMDIYDAGLEVPEDVCLMWCDDNYGYIHHFLRMKNVSGKEETVCITTYLIGDAHMIIYGWVLSHPHYFINK